MKLTHLFAKVIVLSLVGSAAVLTSCKDEEERLTASDTQDITEEALTDAYFQDLDDLGGVVVASPAEDEYSGGRSATTITLTDDRCKCAGVTIEANGTIEHPEGLIIVDFGEGCTDNNLNVRKGKLKFAYSGWRFMPESEVVLTTENYYINGVKLEGMRTSTNVQGSTEDAPKFRVVLTNGKAIFPDGSVALRQSDITWKWIRGENPIDDYLIIDQQSEASGITRGGRTYQVSLVEELKYKRFCGIAVDGIKRYILDEDKEVIIDYGNGTCDKSVAITVNDVTHNITVN